MLDERGRDVSSEQMASLIADAGNTVCLHLIFTYFCLLCQNGEEKT